MRYGFLGLALFAGLVPAAGPAAAKVCQAGPLVCATTMPLGGYCECTAHGATEGGTVVAHVPSHRKLDATAGGCGANPNAPGCR